MTKNLVVVESPAKARTIERYLGPDYKVLASYGHVRDLPENPGRNKLGVDVEHDFKPEYVVADDRRKQLDSITKAAKSADAVYLATDLDREGEAIAWHVAEAAAVPEGKRRRVTFSEITRDAITDAFQHPRSIDEQPGRRSADAPDHGSAGRLHAQPAALAQGPGGPVGRSRSVGRCPPRRRARTRDPRLRRRASTGPSSCCWPDRSGDTFSAELTTIDGKKAEIGDGETAERHTAALRDTKPVVDSVDNAYVQRNPGAAVHDLDPAAGGEPQARLQSRAHDARRPAPVRGHGHRRRARRSDHLHAHRLDDARRRRRWARRARSSASRYGLKYVMPRGRVYKTKTKGAQEAHEAIRPTSFARDPDSLAGVLDGEELRLYLCRSCS